MTDSLRDRIAAVLNRHKTADVYDECADRCMGCEDCEAWLEDESRWIRD